MIKNDIDALYSNKRSRWAITLICLLAALFLTIVFAVRTGSVNIPTITVAKILLSKAFPISKSWSTTYEVIVIDVRLPRVLLGALIGSALAVAGTAMQGLFKNPMASPYIVGVSSGAAFGASLAIVSGAAFSMGIYCLPLLAFLFAALTVFIVYNIAKVRGRVPIETLLLAGIAVGSFFSALVSFMMYIAGEELSSIVFWLMGGLWASSWDKLVIAFPLIFLGIIGIFLFSRDLNIMLMGEEPALDLGIEVERVKKIILIFASLITASAVSVSGIIGFVGLIIPHVVRIFVGPDHRILLPSSCLVGAIFLIWMDTLARSIIEPTELPVGIITALFGIPFFLYLLRKRKRIIGW